MVMTAARSAGIPRPAHVTEPRAEYFDTHALVIDCGDRPDGDIVSRSWMIEVNGSVSTLYANARRFGSK